MLRRSLHMIFTFALLLAAITSPVVAFAQEAPKVGLALSGGSARGFAHIGVLKVFEEIDMPVDLVTGTSMGSVVGGLLASGYTAAEMESLAVNVDWLSILAKDVGRRQMSMEIKRWDERYLATMGLDGWRIQLPSGLRSGQELMMLYNRLVLPYQDLEELPIPLACVAQDLVTGDPYVIDRGDISEAVRASMAIPWVLTPIEKDGRILGDGGMARNLPAQETRERGADVVIGIDIGPTAHERKDLGTMFNVLTQSALLNLQKDTKEQYEHCDVVIVPDLEGLGLADFDKADVFIARGEEAARAMLPQLQSLADSLRSAGNNPPKAPQVVQGPVAIGSMAVTGLDQMRSRVVKADMGFELPDTITVKNIEKGITRMYGSGFYERVTYRFAGPEDSTVLHLDVIEKSRNLFRVGLRYDSLTKLSLLLNTTFRNVVLHGSALTLDLRIADQYELEIRHAVHTGLLRSLGVLTRLNTARADLAVFENNVQVGEFQPDYVFAEITLGTIFSTTAALSFGFRAEYIDSEPKIGGAGLAGEIDKQVPVIANLEIDTYDQTIYPTKGLFVDLAAERSFGNVGNNEAFTRVHFDGKSVIPVSRNLSILFNIYIGGSSGAPPLVYNFAMGGVNTPWAYLGADNSFMGLNAQQRVGPHMQAVTLGAQYEVMPNMYGQLRWTAGNTFDESNIKIESGRYINGVGVTFGVRVLRGRVEATFSTSEVEDFLTHLTIGSAF